MAKFLYTTVVSYHLQQIINQAQDSLILISPYLKISERTLKEWRWHGRGPCFRRHAGHVLYHIDDLDSWSQASAKIAAAMGAGQ